MPAWISGSRPKVRSIFWKSTLPAVSFIPRVTMARPITFCSTTGWDRAGFLRRIMAEGLARYARKQKPYRVSRGALGNGLFVTRPIAQGEVIMAGEEKPYRLVTLQHVERHWREAARQTFRQYAFPIGTNTYIIWNLDPTKWEPLNHSCNPMPPFMAGHGRVAGYRDRGRVDGRLYGFFRCADGRILSAVAALRNAGVCEPSAQIVCRLRPACGVRKQG